MSDAEQPQTTDDTEHFIQAGQGEHLTLTNDAQLNLGKKNRHIFKPDDTGGYSAVCGYKSAPSNLKGKHIVPMDRFEIILNELPLCKGCRKETGLEASVLELDELREYARNGYDSEFVLDAEEAATKFSQNRIPVRLGASIEIDLPLAAQERLLELISKSPHLIESLGGMDRLEDEIIDAAQVEPPALEGDSDEDAEDDD